MTPFGRVAYDIRKGLEYIVADPPLAVEDEIIRITGVSIAAVAGIGAGLAQTILSEIGTDMSKWPSEKHFTSWLGVASHNAISGGKVLHSRTLPTRNRAGQAFRQAATSVSNTSSAFGAFSRVAALRLRIAQPSTSSLTPRELEVLRCIAQGYNNREIAMVLVIELRTENSTSIISSGN